MTKKVDFLIVGAQKCGTTSLYNSLSQHPELLSGIEKEPGFWAITSDWKRNIDEYHTLFDFENRKDRLIFEASTIYTFYPHRNLAIWKDIYEYNPKTKIIYIVRNPLDRIVSSWMHTYQSNRENLPLNEAVVKNGLYIDLCRYYTQISPWIKTFGSENVLILDFEELKNQKELIMSKVAVFLNINKDILINQKNIISNKSIGEQKVIGKFRKFTKYAQKFQESTPKTIQNIVRPIWRKFAYNNNRIFDKRPALTKQNKEMVLHLLELEIVKMEELMDRSLDSWRKY